MRFVADYTTDLGELTRRAGSRGRWLAEMARLKAPVPPGFIVSDVVCRRFLETGDLPRDAWEEVLASLDRSAAELAELGVTRPLLFSVRSSPTVAMPGVLNSALYLGITGDNLDALADWGGAEFAAAARLGFLKSLGRLRGLSPARYRGVVADIVGPIEQTSPAVEELEAIGDAYEAVVVDVSQRAVPSGLHDQVREGVEAVFASWDGAEARRHRRRHGIPDDDGMALVIHPMIFGEVGLDSGAGIAFSRRPDDGSPGLTGIYSPGVSRPKSQSTYPGLAALEESDPTGYAVIAAAAADLEQTRRDLIRLDYVREQGRVWIIEARRADRTAEAAVRVAVDLVEEGLLTCQEALQTVDPEALAGMLHPRLTEAPGIPLAVGTATSPGAASGPVVLNAAAAIAAAEAGTPAILVLREVLPRDLDGVVTAAGLITSHGGGTSHAALAARGAGTPAVTGIVDLALDASSVRFSGREFKVGEALTIDGVSGAVYPGTLPIAQPPGAEYLDRLLEWADDVRTLGVWANADTARAATAARDAGAEGIGLARTEYMFQGEDRLAVVRRILLSDDGRDRADALEELESLQVADFEELLAAMDGTPVVVRLLDPPVHEFLPSRVDVEVEMAQRRASGESVVDLEKLDAAIDHWSEVNPMLGLRGVRLAVVIPEIYRVQVLAALEAVRRRLDADGDPRLELMVPLVGSIEELHLIRDMIEEEVHSAGRLLEVAIGTMIELPRAALMAGELALESDFFSFGTNDLTQTTMGLSRDDSEEAFLRTYVEQGLMPVNPFQRIDPVGVGGLIQQAIVAGRAANPGLEIGVCGEHGGDPVSIRYFHQWGVDYVSCSPPRLPITRLAAAQAALEDAT